MRKRFTKVSFTALIKTNYKYKHNGRYSHFVPIPTFRTDNVGIVLRKVRISTLPGNSTDSYLSILASKFTGEKPCRGRQHSFVEIDHEIFSTVILSLPLIQEGQLSVSGERMCTILVNRLED